MNTLQHKFWNLTISIVDHCNYNCKDCIHFTAYRPKKEHQAKDFIPSIQLMLDKGIITDQEMLLCGGEPFLHSDLIGLVNEMAIALPTLPITIITNGFWLAHNPEKYYDMFRKIRRLSITKYTKINEDPIAEIRKFTHVFMRTRTEFASLNFTSEPIEPNIPEVAMSKDHYCRFVDCIQLLPDRRLMKCPAGYASISNYPTTSEFRNSIDMIYDLDNPKEDFQVWWNRYPFDACYYCRLTERSHSFSYKI